MITILKTQIFSQLVKVAAWLRNTVQFFVFLLMELHLMWQFEKPAAWNVYIIVGAVSMVVRTLALRLDLMWILSIDNMCV